LNVIKIELKIIFGNLWCVILKLQVYRIYY